MAGDQLLIDIPIPDDGAGDELGEEGDIAGKVHEVVGGLAVIPIHVDEVGHRLEGVEGDADGQGDVHLRQGGEGGNPPQRVHEEARVLKHPQGSQVQHDAHHQHGPAAALGGLLVHQHPGKEVHQDGGDHNEHIDRLAIGIED